MSINAIKCHQQYLLYFIKSNYFLVDGQVDTLIYT